jgi:uncharacterized protein YbdZ (MbtH family)
VLNAEPITPYNVAYVVVDTAEPSHRIHPVGAAVPAYCIIEPDGVNCCIAVLDSLVNSMEPASMLVPAEMPSTKVLTS